MTVVTLTGDLGSMGTIAARVAAAMGYALADRELLLEAAQALGWSEAEVTAFDERTAGQGSRLARFLRDFVQVSPVDLDAGSLGELAATMYGSAALVPEIQSSDLRYIDVLSALVLSLAEHGNVVIVGRGGQALLAGREDTAHVRIACEIDERVRRIAERDHMTLVAARARVEDSDRQRAAWHRKYFDVSHDSSDLYQMVLNSGRLSDESAARLVVELVHRIAPRPEPGIGQAVAAAPIANGALARVRQDWGWVELLDPSTRVPLVRAHLFAAGGAADGGWSGQLESVRIAHDASALRSGQYGLRLAGSTTDYRIDLELADGVVRVRGSDPDLPAILQERSGGE